MIYICHICFFTEWRTQYSTQLVWTEGKKERKGNWNGAHNPGGESETWAAQLSCWTRWRRQIGPIWQFWVRVCGLGYNANGCLGTGVPILNTGRNIVYLWTPNMTGSPHITSKCFFHVIIMQSYLATRFTVSLIWLSPIIIQRQATIEFPKLVMSCSRLSIKTLTTFIFLLLCTVYRW